MYEHILQLALNPQSNLSLVYKLLTGQHPAVIDQRQPAVPKKKKTCTKGAASSVFGFEIKTATNRKGVKLAIKILQQALDAGKYSALISHMHMVLNWFLTELCTQAGGDESESDSGKDDGGV